MNPIRPQLPLQTPPARPAGEARAAFFQAVKAAAPSPTVQPAAARVAGPAATARPQAAPDPAPARYLRPGSLVDIKV